MRLWLMVGAGAVLVASRLVGHAASAPDGIDGEVRAVAAGMSAVTPKTMDHGMVLRSVRADGSTLAIGMDGMRDWHPTYTDEEMTRMLGATLCARPGIPTLVGRGARLRFEMTTPAGWPLPSLTVDRCDAGVTAP